MKETLFSLRDTSADKVRIRIIAPDGAHDPLSDNTQVYIGLSDTKTGKRWTARPLVFTEVTEGSMPMDATINLDNEQARVFMRDLLGELKRNGLEINIEAEGELKATKYHLEDMRSMVLTEKKE